MLAPARRPRWVLLSAIVMTTVACAGASAPPPSPSTSATAPTSSPAPSPSPTASPSWTPSPSTSPTPTPTPSTADDLADTTIVAVRVESRVDDHPTHAFRARVEDVLTDPRGWQRAGFTFTFDDPAAPYTIVLAEGDEVDELCRPMDTFGAYSCQNGPVVALNADRWRTATSSWTDAVEEYRTMLVNHEVGHLLHLHHPEPQCPGEGFPAPVMMQQSSELGACSANPWPLQWEIDLAAEQAEPLAPPASHDAWDHRPSPPPAFS